MTSEDEMFGWSELTIELEFERCLRVAISTDDISASLLDLGARIDADIRISCLLDDTDLVLPTRRSPCLRSATAGDGASLTPDAVGFICAHLTL